MMMITILTVHDILHLQEITDSFQVIILRPLHRRYDQRDQTSQRHRYKVIATDYNRNRNLNLNRNLNSNNIQLMTID